MQSLDKVLKHLNEEVLKCDSLHRFRVEQKNGFTIYFWIREIGKFQSLGDTVQFLENLSSSISALEEYY